MKNLLSFIVILAIFCTTSFGQETEKENFKMKPALLIIDVQKEFTPMMSQGDQAKALEMMNWSMWTFRNANLPVIRVYHVAPEWGLNEESPGFAFHDSLKISSEDPRIVKTYGSAFTKTNLVELLKEKEINTLFLCGLSSTGCVLATYMDAASHDYKAFMIKDAMLGPTEEYTDNVEKMFSALDLDTVMYMLKVLTE
jgi:nicotinamidase-related amidase